MKKTMAIFLVVITIATLILIIFNTNKNNIKCSYLIKQDDYRIEYSDIFYYLEDQLTSIKHTVTYQMSKDSTKDSDQIYKQLLHQYQEYKDISISSKLNKQKIQFTFTFDLNSTLEDRYNEFLGFRKEWLLNSYPDDLIKRYQLDYSDSTCKMIK